MSLIAFVMPVITGGTKLSMSGIRDKNCMNMTCDNLED